MQFTLLTFASLLAFAIAQDTIASEIAKLPSCAVTCLQTAVTAANCGQTDYACQCGSGHDAITRQATPCIAGACSASDALTVQQITNQICVIQAASSSSASVSSSVASSVSSSISSALSSASSSISSSISASTSKAASSASKSSASSTSSAASSTSSAVNMAGSVNAGGLFVGAAALVALAL